MADLPRGLAKRGLRELRTDAPAAEIDFGGAFTRIFREDILKKLKERGQWGDGAGRAHKDSGNLR